jgi:selenium-binding protein 1
LLHNPREMHGFVGAVLGGTVWHLFDTSPFPDSVNRHYKADKVIQVDPVEVEGKLIPPMPTDLVIAMSDQHLYLSNWLHGDVRQYDVGDPAKPKLTGQVFLGGLLGKGTALAGRKLWGGPQSLQLSLDCKRLYVTNSFFSAWDNHYYPEIAKQGSWMVQIDCDRDKGGMKLNENFFVAFPGRAREVHCNGGDCTSDIFV